MLLAVAAALVPGVAFAAPEELFKLQDEPITESSGLAVSVRHQGIVYTHNDSSDGPRVYAAPMAAPAPC